MINLGFTIFYVYSLRIMDIRMLSQENNDSVVLGIE